MQAPNRRLHDPRHVPGTAHLSPLEDIHRPDMDLWSFRSEFALDDHRVNDQTRAVYLSFEASIEPNSVLVKLQVISTRISWVTVGLIIVLSLREILDVLRQGPHSSHS